MHPDDGRVVSNLILQALENKPITIYGDGAQTRSFCYVDDLIEALIRLMNAPDDLVGPVNIGNPAETNILELAQTILELTGSSSALQYRKLPSDDPRKRCPDISQAKEKLGWTPRVSLREGLTRTIEYFEEVLKKGGRPARMTKGTVPAGRVGALPVLGSGRIRERKEIANASACDRSGPSGFDGRP
jgi:UDP-glucuronate decarboxylase